MTPAVQQGVRIPHACFMKRGFSLIEVLIGVFVLALALLGIAAVFATNTSLMADNTDKVFGRHARINGEALYRTLDRGAAPLAPGWNHEPLGLLGDGIRVAAFTFHRPGYIEPDITVLVSCKDTYEYRTEWFDDYAPVNRDLLISWYGFVHAVEDDETRGVQEFEKAYPFIILSYEKNRVLDHHRFQYVRELDK